MPKVATKHAANGQVKTALQKLKVPKQPEDSILWMGPSYNGALGGITQSMINHYLVDRERFRVKNVLGLREEPCFQHRQEFGNMWHIMEECFAANKDEDYCNRALLDYTKKLIAKYRDQQKEIIKWYNVVRVTFPIYKQYWAKHKDVKNRKPVFQEKVFSVPYKLPSGRVVYMRGKFDAVDLINKGLYQQENKTKGDVDPEELKHRLLFDLQTMFYTIALIQFTNDGKDLGGPVKGVRYNVVRRPLSGGKHTIKQREGKGKNKTGAETETQFYERLAGVIKENADYFFFRWTVEISKHDILRFQHKCLNPVLENLVDDYEWWVLCFKNGWDVYDFKLRNDRCPDHQQRHYLLPFGLYNPLSEGRGTCYDDYLMTGSTRGLIRAETLFTELQDG